MNSFAIVSLVVCILFNLPTGASSWWISGEVAKPQALNATHSTTHSPSPTTYTHANVDVNIQKAAKNGDDVFGVILLLEKMFADGKFDLLFNHQLGPYLLFNPQLLGSLGLDALTPCVSDLYTLVVAAKKRARWALEMIDANGKPDSGLLRGNLVFHAEFDQCMDIDTGLDFEGQFCTVGIGILQMKHITLSQPVGFGTGLCVPSTCDAEKLRTLINAYMYFNPEVSGGVFRAECKDRHQSLSGRAIFAIIVISIFLTLIVIGTAYDVYGKIMTEVIMSDLTTRPRDDSMTLSNAMGPSTSSNSYSERKPIIDLETHRGSLYSKDNPVSSNEDSTKVKVVAIFQQIFKSFSVYTNGSKLLATEQRSDSITCINGLRFISLVWIIVFHFYFSKGTPMRANWQAYMDEAYDSWTFMSVLCGGIAVETFFSISGLLVAYLTLKELGDGKKELNARYLGHFYLHRIWRLTPTYMFVLMTHVSLFQYMGDGPAWADKGWEKDYCEDTWWTNLLYINNFLYPHKMCMEWTWYLANDMQFYLLSPLLFLPMYYFNKRGLIAPVTVIYVNIVCCGIISHANDLAAIQRFEEIPEDRDMYWSEYYIKPYTRIGSYAVGVMTGFLLYKTQCEARIPKLAVLFGWTISTAMSLTIVFGLSGHLTDDRLSTSVAALYNALHNVGWAMATCWVIFACASGYGGFVNTFLSWKAFVPLSRLTYCAYLTHPIVITIFFLSKRRMFYMEETNIVYSIFGVTAVTYVVACLVYLAYEAPMAELEKVVKKKKKKAVNT